MPSGIPGAGRTTLPDREGRMGGAVIVNDLSEANIDAEPVRREAELSRSDEDLVEMTDGCICCPRAVTC